MKGWFAIIVAGFVLAGCSESDPSTPNFNPVGPEEAPWVPEVVPVLDAIPSGADGEGSARLEPRGPFSVNSIHSFRTVFTVGSGGIEPQGHILLQISPWWGWSQPQDRSEPARGYIRVYADTPTVKLQSRILPLNRVLIWSGQERLEPGTEIVIEYKNARVDRFAEQKELFQIFVDADGDGHSAPIKNPPFLATTATEASKLQVTAPSIAHPGEKIRIGVYPLDPVNNWGTFPPGEYILEYIDENRSLTVTEKMLGAGKNKLEFDFVLPHPGLWFFRVKGPAGLLGKSNVVWCREGEASQHLYFGDIHGHSRISDGTGTMEDFYRYARQVSGLDIAVLTDHADYGTIQVPGPVWDRNCVVANREYEPGKFVTYAGFEWTNWRFGHRNVYYRDGQGPIFRSLDAASDTPEELWKLLEPYPAMTVAHHPGGGPVPIDWSIPPSPREFLVEISSIHGSSEYYGCEKSIYRPVRGAFVSDALKKGYRLGLIGGGDTHDGHPGTRSQGALVTGIMGVWAQALTRDAVWAALSARRVYATTGPKIILNFQVGGSPMGSEISWKEEEGSLPLVWQVIGCSPLERIEVIRDGEVVFSRSGQGLVDRGLLEDPAIPQAGSWYYLKVVQADGNMAWSSPVWVN